MSNWWTSLTLVAVFEAAVIAFFIGLTANGSWPIMAISFVVGLPVMLWWNARS